MHTDALRLDGTAALEITASATGAKGKRRFRIVAATGAPLRGQGQYGWDYPVIIDLAGIKAKAETPILDNHGPGWGSPQSPRYSVVGQSESAKVERGEFVLRGGFFEQEQAAKDILRLADQGFKWQASIGATSTKKEFIREGQVATVNGQEHAGPCYVSWITEVREVSFVVIGDDSGTSVVVADGKGATVMAKKTFAAYCKANGKGDPDKMDAKMKARMKARFEEDDEDEDDTKADGTAGLNIAASANLPPPTPPAPAPSVGDEFRAEMDRQLNAARTQAATELTRQQAIAAVFRSEPAITGEVEVNGAKTTVNLQQHAITAGWTAEQAELQLLRLQNLRASRPQGPFGAGPHLHFPQSAEMTEAVMECAVLQAARHQYQLDQDDFYQDTDYHIRRVPGHIEKQVKRELAARYDDKTQQHAHDLFKGQISPVRLLVATGRQNGYRGTDRPTSESEVEVLLRAQNWRQPGQNIQADGSSTMSIANVLANVQNKFMLQGYLFVEQAWRQACGIRPVGDFKPTKSINLLGTTEFSQLGPAGELRHADLGDQAFANQAFPYGRICTIPWTNLVNDDLGILSTVPMKIGQGAGLALNKLVWATWGNPGNGDDGNSFFTTGRTTFSNGTVAGNDNSMSGGSSVLSSTSLNSAKVLFDNQIDPNGNPLGFDGAKPVLLFPPDLWQTAMELVDPAAIGIVYGGASTSRQPNVNLWKGRFEPAMSRYLNKSYTVGEGGQAITTTGSTTAWYILFNPVALAAIEVCFLNGVDVPTVQQAGPDYQFDRLGISIRGTMPFGVTMQNFRAAVKSAGA